MINFSSRENYNELSWNIYETYFPFERKWKIRYTGENNISPPNEIGLISLFIQSRFIEDGDPSSIMNFNRVSVRISAQRIDTPCWWTSSTGGTLKAFQRLLAQHEIDYSTTFRKPISSLTLYFDLPASKSTSGRGKRRLTQPLTKPFSCRLVVVAFKGHGHEPPIARKRSCFVNEASASLEKLNTDPSTRLYPGTDGI